MEINYEQIKVNERRIAKVEESCKLIKDYVLQYDAHVIQNSMRHIAEMQDEIMMSTVKNHDEFEDIEERLSECFPHNSVLFNKQVVLTLVNRIKDIIKDTPVQASINPFQKDHVPKQIKPKTFQDLLKFFIGGKNVANDKIVPREVAEFIIGKTELGKLHRWYNKHTGKNNSLDSEFPVPKNVNIKPQVQESKQSKVRPDDTRINNLAKTRQVQQTNESEEDKFGSEEDKFESDDGFESDEDDDAKNPFVKIYNVTKKEKIEGRYVELRKKYNLSKNKKTGSVRVTKNNILEWQPKHKIVVDVDPSKSYIIAAVVRDDGNYKDRTENPTKPTKLTK